MPSDESNVLTVREILKKYSEFGIPHFQRGLVWKNDSVSLLLESLYYGTPCGTLIFWKPKNPLIHGVPMPGAKSFDMLVIDGQQRIRSIYGALKGLPLVTRDDNETNDTDKKWCVNLSKIKEFKNVFDTGLEDYPLFYNVMNPLNENARFKFNLIPIEIFLDDNIQQVRWDLIKPISKKRMVLEAINRPSNGLKAKIREIYNRELFKVIKKETNKENNLNDMVQLYNRINSSGKKVEAEEMAYSSLISISLSANDWLRELFLGIHKKKKDAERDDVLQRLKEKKFGFKLFIRTFMQAYSYHRGYDPSSGSFSFDLASRTEFSKDLGGGGISKIGDLLNRTEKALLYSHEILFDLGCDDLRQLPETMSLLPIFQLLVKFPKLVDYKEYKQVISWLTLNLLLFNKGKDKIIEIVKSINRSNRLIECINILKKYMDHSSNINEIKKSLLKSNSLQDRYVLLLYWLLRKNGAKDFSYENILDADHKKDANKKNILFKKYGKEALLNNDVHPEKQHIVPYSILKKIYGIGGRTRQSINPVNNIGNITFISRNLNHWETGLGDRPIDFKCENDDENLRSHFLLEKDEKKDKSGLGKLYINVLDEKRKNSERKRDYEEFCRRRRKLISNGFKNWLDELFPTISISTDMEPEGRFFKPTFKDDIRDRYGFNYDMKETLIKMLDKEEIKAKRENDGNLVLNDKRNNVKLKISSDRIILKHSNSKRSLQWANEFLKIIIKEGMSEFEKDQDRIIFKRPLDSKEENRIIKAIKEISRIFELQIPSQILS